jgi:lipopolysaccharide/colanic/teichoic acid biosynthesis glycosyltransferase
VATIRSRISRQTQATDQFGDTDDSIEESHVRHVARVIERAYHHEMLGQPADMAEAVYRVSKRALDITVASVLLIGLSPVLVLIAVLVRLDSPGPAFFVQERIGQGGRLFRMLKFRTMTVGDGDLSGLEPHKRPDDRRITRLGSWLRRTSLDELPQLVNVIVGDMSLVGPRPEIPAIALRHYATWQYRRLSVPQGLTGWWQVNGRGARLMHKHTEDDLYYIEHASFWFDVKVLLLTIRVVIRRDGAF